MSKVCKTENCTNLVRIDDTEEYLHIHDFCNPCLEQKENEYREQLEWDYYHS